ncbi:TolC family protein [bacterium]|nr:TolC family protein [bacterium]
MLKKILIFILINFLFTFPANAVVKRCSVEEAVNLALKNNLALQAKKKELEIVKQDIQIANQLKNPQFQSNFLIGKVTEGNSSQFGIAVPVEVSKRGVRKRAALAQYDIVENEVRAKEHEIKIDVMRAYFEVLYHKSMVHIMQDRENVFKDMYDIAKEKAQKSPVYKVDMLQADIRYKKQLVVLNKEKSQLLNAQFHLNEVMNMRDTSDMYDTQELYILGDPAILNITLPDYKVIEDTALKYSYAIRIAENSIVKSQADLKVARHKVIPDAAVAAGYAFQRSTHIGGAFVGAYMDLPLFTTYRADVNRAKVVVEKSSLDKESFENKLKMTLKQEYNEFKYSKENIGYYKEILKESEEILKMSTNRYRHGETQFLNLMAIEHQRQELLMEYISAVLVYYDAYLDLMYNMGHDILLEEEIL